MVLLPKVRFRVGFCITSTNGWGRRVGVTERLTRPLLGCLLKEGEVFRVVKAVASALWLRNVFCYPNFSCGSGEVSKKMVQVKAAAVPGLILFYIMCLFFPAASFGLGRVGVRLNGAEQPFAGT